MTEHVVGIRPVKRALMTPETWQGFCSCGWFGEDYTVSSRGAGLYRKGRASVQEEARRDALAHSKAVRP